TFSVTATNVAGTGPAGTAATTPRTIPSVPLDVMAVPDNHQVTVSWQAPLTNGGAAISGYTVTTTPASAGCTTGGALTCTVTGLTNGTPYQFTVTATNVAGASSASAPPVTSTPRTVPGAPTALAAVPGNEEVELTWTAPADNGGAIILGYTVTASPGGAQCQTNGPRTCIVSGLTNGQLYSFTVTAMNVAGTGAPSASASATPVRVPDPPTGVSATRGVGSVTLAWSAPVNQGGSAVTSYAVSGPGTSGCTTIATSCTVGALAAGQNYTFTVIATNAVGDGLASDAVTAAPLTIPTIPRNVQSGRAGNASSVASNLRVSWNAPLSNGGTPIVRYTVIGGGATCSTAGLTCILTGITRLPTMVTVVATNIVGDSASGTVVSPARLATFNIGKRSPATRKFYGSGVVPGQRVRIYSVVNSHLVYLTSTVVNSRLQWSKIVTVPYGYRTWVVKSRQWRSGVRHTNR
ncbi:MAG: fibronectin type III domain-containing protein, partial [Actinomycetes bacterium]